MGMAMGPTIQRTYRLPPDLAERLRAQAAREGSTETALVHALLVDGLARREAATRRSGAAK
jgi:predicted DNA-binding protein